jgi:hypothetical protein
MWPPLGRWAAHGGRGGAPVWQQGGHPQNRRAALTEKGPPLAAALRKRGGPKGGLQGRQAGPGEGRPESGQRAGHRAALAP